MCIYFGLSVFVGLALNLFVRSPIDNYYHCYNQDETSFLSQSTCYAHSRDSAKAFDLGSTIDCIVDLQIF